MYQGEPVSLRNAITTLKSNPPATEAAAKTFLNTLPAETQDQLIAAVYLGREHIHCTELRDDVEMSRSYTDHIDKEEYPRILHEKSESIPTYLSKLETCANASGFDLDQL